MFDSFYFYQRAISTLADSNKMLPWFTFWFCCLWREEEKRMKKWNEEDPEYTECQYQSQYQSRQEITQLPLFCFASPLSGTLSFQQVPSCLVPDRFVFLEIKF